MWILKIRMDYRNFLLGNLAKKYNVDFTGYPVTYYKDKKRVLSNLKNIKDIVNVEFKNDFVIAVIKQPLFSEVAYNPKFIKPRPDFISDEGYHIWEFAAWEKKDLKPIISRRLRCMS